MSSGYEIELLGVTINDMNILALDSWSWKAVFPAHIQGGYIAKL